MMPKPQSRPARIDVATLPEPRVATVAIATCRDPYGVGFRYQAVSLDRRWSCDVASPSREAAILDAMTSIHRDLADRSGVRFLVSLLGTSPLWRYKNEFADLLPGASIDWPSTDELSLMEAARFGLSAPAARIAASAPRRSAESTEPLTVATDGSVRGGYAGIGWLACDGRYGLSGSRHPTAVTGAAAVLASELRAIGDVVRSLRDQPLTVASDSKTALKMATGWMAGDDVLPHGCNTFHTRGLLAELMTDRELIYTERDRLNLVWVRGHRGEPLNEGADALARLARRRAATPADLSLSEYQRRAAGLATAFASEYNKYAATRAG